MNYKTYDALYIAKYIINKCTSERNPITNLQLQKILYFLQREHLIQYGNCLFSDEIQAWQFGPVVPEVYYHFCGFGSSVITMNYNIDISKFDIELIDPIVEDKRDKKPWDLVAETHGLGKAWDIVYKNGKGNKRVIPVELIRTRG